MSDGLRSSSLKDVRIQGNRLPPGPWADGRVYDTDDVLRLVEGLRRDYGDVVRLSVPFGNHVVVSRPDLVKYVLHRQNFRRTSPLRAALGNGLLTSNGGYWRQQKLLMQPVFRQKAIAKFDRVIIDVAEELVRRWAATAGESRSVEILSAMRSLTLDIITQALFSARLGTYVNEVSAAISVINAEIGTVMQSPLLPARKLDPGFTQRLDTSREVLDEAVERIISVRLDKEGVEDDLLTILMKSVPKGSSSTLSPEQVRDEVVTMLLAGAETTASLLTWCLCLLGQHQDAYKRVQEEIDLKLSGEHPTTRGIAGLEYTEQVLMEAMRLYPPVWIMSRVADQDDEIDDYYIPAGSTIWIIPWLLHRLPEYWQEPLRFDPSRFAPDRGASRPRYAFCPFGGGRHTCIGEPFAMMEAKLIIARLFQVFGIRTDAKHPVIPEAGVILQPKDGVSAVLEVRPGAIIGDLS